MTLDINNFYPNTPLTRYEYILLKINSFTEDVIEEYDLNKKATKDGWLYVEIFKGMNGLPQVGILVQHF